jgi:uncharacterized protein (DUF305 family)
MKRLSPLMVAIMATFALAACGDNNEGQTTGGQGVHNQADVTFAEDMIVHHREALVMAEMALAQASNPEVKDLARQIKATEGTEIQKMSDWLTSWSVEVPADMTGMDHDDRPGMMGQQQLNDLKATTGNAFDRRFLIMMIEHHQGAIDMAQVARVDGENPDVKSLAEKIRSAQTAEITRMSHLLYTSPA